MRRRSTEGVINQVVPDLSRTHGAAERHKCIGRLVFKIVGENGRSQQAGEGEYSSMFPLPIATDYPYKDF